MKVNFWFSEWPASHRCLSFLCQNPIKEVNKRSQSHPQDGQSWGLQRKEVSLFGDLGGGGDRRWSEVHLSIWGTMSSERGPRVPRGSSEEGPQRGREASDRLSVPPWPFQVPTTRRLHLAWEALATCFPETLSYGTVQRSWGEPPAEPERLHVEGREFQLVSSGPAWTVRCPCSVIPCRMKQRAWPRTTAFYQSAASPALLHYEYKARAE